MADQSEIDALHAQLAEERKQKHEALHREYGRREALERKLVDARAELETLRELSVTNILIDITPGWDGMGHEVYAKSVEQVVRVLSDLAEKVESLERGPWPEWAEKCLKIIRKHSGYDGFDDASEGVDLPEELSELLDGIDVEDRRKRDQLAATQFDNERLRSYLSEISSLPAHPMRDKASRIAATALFSPINLDVLNEVRAEVCDQLCEKYSKMANSNWITKEAAAMVAAQEATAYRAKAISSALLVPPSASGEASPGEEE